VIDRLGASTGITQRFYAPNDWVTSDLALPAAREALNRTARNALSPWTDLALTGQSLHSNARSDPLMDVKRLPAYAQRYLAGADPRHPYASPLYGDALGLPPLLIQVGSDEILRDDAVRMAEKFRGAGGEVELEEWPRMPHGWHHYARIIPEGRRAIERIGVFVQIRLN
jgi:monoterpene epsilon-lactone hydrolase